MLVLPSAVILAALALAFVLMHHIAYFRRVRQPTFGAFLETGGWLILLLVALSVLAGGLRDPGTARVGAVSAAVGVLCILAGLRIQRRTVSRPNG